jgi:predicted nucleotide-binding protein
VSREVLAAELDARIAMGHVLEERAADVGSDDDLAAARADYYIWDEYNRTLLEQRFSTDRIARDYAWWGMMSMGPQTPSEELLELRNDITRKIRRLTAVREQVPLFPEPEAPRASVAADGAEAARTTIFIVHGRDDATKLAVHGFLRAVTSLEPVILHEQASSGRTIIEKFEDHAADAAFAVILLTADDEGGLSGGEHQPRARQNVIFEFGFFVAALGRHRVAILYEHGVERPSDIDGVAYISLDAAGAWKVALARELRAAQLPVDAEQLL